MARSYAHSSQYEVDDDRTRGKRRERPSFVRYSHEFHRYIANEVAAQQDYAARVSQAHAEEYRVGA